MNHTLDYAYDDYCIAQLAKALDPSKEIYVIGSPAFPMVTVYVQRPDGSLGEFVIEARNASEENIYSVRDPEHKNSE